MALLIHSLLNSYYSDQEPQTADQKPPLQSLFIYHQKQASFLCYVILSIYPTEEKAFPYWRNERLKMNLMYLAQSFLHFISFFPPPLNLSSKSSRQEVQLNPSF